MRGSEQGSFHPVRGSRSNMSFVHARRITQQLKSLALESKVLDFTLVRIARTSKVGDAALEIPTETGAPTGVFRNSTAHL
jgi:hypothetical protein